MAPMMSAVVVKLIMKVSCDCWETTGRNEGQRECHDGTNAAVWEWDCLVIDT